MKLKYACKYLGFESLFELRYTLRRVKHKLIQAEMYRNGQLPQIIV